MDDLEVIGLEKDDVQVANEVDCRALDPVYAQSLAKSGRGLRRPCRCRHIYVYLCLDGRIALATDSEHLHVPPGFGQGPVDQVAFVRRAWCLCYRQHVGGFEQVAFALTVIALEQGKART